MTAGMATARALSMAGKNWSEVTHIGGVSGGQWFASQLAFSEDFYSSLTTRKPGTDNEFEQSLTEIFTKFGEEYQADAAPPAEIKMNDFCQQGLDVIKNAINDLGPAHVLPEFIEQLLKQSGALSLANWEAFVGAMLKHNVPVDMTYGEAARSGARKGLKTAALVQGLTLPSDAWLTSGADGQPHLKASLSANFAGFPGNKVPEGALLPLTHVMKADDTVIDGWHAPTTADMRLTIEDKHFNRMPNNAPFSLAGVDDTTIASVTAGSSAAGGIMATDMLLHKLLNSLVDKIPEKDKKAKWAARLLEIYLYGNCAPFGMQEVAPRVKVDVPAAGVPEERKTYRTIDGGYIDNSGLASALATMTTDCENGAALNCDKQTTELQVVSINGFSDASSGIPRLFRTDGPFDDNGTTELYSPMKGVPTSKVPKLQIFADDSPSDSAWKTYATETFDGIAQSFEGKWLSVTTKTVDNPAYGVVGGYKVRILFMADNINDPDIAGVMSSDFDPLIVLPAFGQQKFKDVYAPVAESQSQKATPILKQWLERSV